VTTSPATDAAVTGLLAAMALAWPLWLIGLFLMGERTPVAAALLLGPLVGIATAGVVGLVVGWLDAPGRAAVALARRESPVAMLLMSQAAGILLGGLWLGFAGGVTGVSIGVIASIGDQAGDLLGTSLFFGIFGWFTAMFLSTPAMLMHATARALCVRADSPRGVPAFIAGASAIGTQILLATAWAALAVVATALRGL